MEKSTLLHPQFFHTLVHGFHTHLKIPLDFFSKYIEGNSVVEKTMAELKSDSSDITWKVKMSGRRLSDGWEEFAVANNLQTGDVVLVRYEGDIVFHVSDLGPNRCDIPIPSNNINDVSDNDDEELPRKKKVKKNSLDVLNEEEEDMESLMELEKEKYSPKPKRRVSSYSSYSPCRKRLVTFTLPPDYVKLSRLTLPMPLLRENGINKPGEIYLLGKDGTKWPTSLLLDTRGIMRLGNGWKDFVKGNGLETSFTLKLIWKGTTPVFSLCSAESTSDIEEEEFSKKHSVFIDPSKIEDKMSKDENKKEEIRENHLRQRDSTPSSQKQFVTITITPDNLRNNRLRLSKQFAKESSMNKPGMIYLLGKNGTKWMANLVQERDGRTNLGSGWRVFAEANELKPGESFTLESILEDETPMLRFIRTDQSNNSKASKKESVSAEDTEPRNRNSAIQDRFVTLTLAPEDVRPCKLHLPSQYMKANGINKLGKITLLGENKKEWPAYLLSTRDGTVALENGWDGFCEADGVKLGEYFTLEFIYGQGTITVLNTKMIIRKINIQISKYDTMSSMCCKNIFFYLLSRFILTFIRREENY